ncbi:MAG: KEOPS complex kinase/ATPase Bud32 [Candidatus Micrarchaeaceae archaeon]
MVGRIISEGAEAKVSLSEFMGMPAVLKSRIPKRYRIREMDEPLRASRTKSEARVMARLLACRVPVPRLLRVGKYSILMEFIEGKRLSDAIRGGEIKQKVFSDAGKLLAAIHAAGVSHGDFTPANIMLCKGKLFVIDFGLSSSNAEDMDKAIDLLLMKRSLSSGQFASFIKGYSSSEAHVIISKLAEIERMGRYQTRTLETNG